MKWSSNSPGNKLLILCILGVLLLIPSFFVQGILKGRQNFAQRQLSALTQDWGTEQLLRGPYLYVPCKYSAETENGKFVDVYDAAIFLPDVLTLDAELLSDVRAKGLYSATVYSAGCHATGSFSSLPLKSLAKDPRMPIEYFFDHARLVLGLSDASGIQAIESATFNGRALEAGAGLGDGGRSIGSRVSRWDREFSRNEGFHFPLKASDIKGHELNFELGFKLRGSQRMLAAPVGKSSVITMRVDSTDTALTGTLPLRHEILNDLTVAEWDIPFLTRSYGQAFLLSEMSPADQVLVNSSVGLVLGAQASGLTKTLRALDYSPLLILLALLTYFLADLMTGSRAHYIQYIMQGLALTLFFAILGAFSEYLNFSQAYGLGAALVVGIAFFYTRSGLRSTKAALAVGAVYSFAFALLFVLVSFADYAFMISTATVLVALCVLMGITRKMQAMTSL